MGKVYIKTFGCQMNEYDSKRILAVFGNYGFSRAETPEDADFAILNTCSVREKPHHKVNSEMGRLKKIKKRNPSFKIGICGCVAQQEGEQLLKQYPYVDFVIGTEAVSRLEHTLGLVLSGERVSDTELKDKNLSIDTFTRHAGISAFLTIMKGCNNFCSYCIVPYVRGREISRKPMEIINEAKYLVHSGVKEITLLGQNVNSYGKNLDENINFPKLLYMISKIKGLQRLRFVTSHPKDFSDDLLSAIKDINLICEYLHLPLQSGSDNILKRMNRKYTYENYKEKVLKAKDQIPDIAVSSDFIVGFPGESEADFEKTVSALREIEYESVFAFKYSPRPHTAAAELKDDIPEKEKNRRLSRLLDVQSEITANLLKQYIGGVCEVLVEGMSKRDEGIYTGRNRQNRVVNFKSSVSLNPGDIVNVTITQAKKNSLFGINTEESILITNNRRQ